MSRSTAVIKYKKACWAIAWDFQRKYFPENPDGDWVGEEVGGIYIINDYFFDLDYMVKCLDLDLPEDVMFDYYDYVIGESGYDVAVLTLGSWLSLNKKKHA